MNAVPAMLDIDLDALAQGQHPRPFEVLGAHAAPGGQGVRFAVWAPNARAVHLVGDFNDWQGSGHGMERRRGVWELLVPEARPGQRYRFEVLGEDGQTTVLKADPYARAAELRPATASVVAPLPARRSLPRERAAANARGAPISIYEVHLGSWRRTEDDGFLHWDALADTLLPYVADLGFTHVELMPISEHPFDGSWGYQALGQYAPSARFGEPDGLRRFVEACHARGVGVLLDWVPAHFPTDAHGLGRFDGTPLYEYADPREGFHPDWRTYIYNFGKPEVANFLAGSALYRIERFGVDGLRVDAVASMLYRDYSRPSGEWVPNVEGGRHNFEAIALLKRINDLIGRECPGAVTMAEESTTFFGVTAPTRSGGLGFNYKWNLGWMHDTLVYMAHPPAQRTLYHECVSFGLEYAFSEQFVLPLSHDEVVHGKGSLWQRMPGDEAGRFANLRAYYGFMWGHPGKKLLFMGQEFAQPTEWNFDEALPWDVARLTPHAGVQRLVRELNGLYRREAALHGLDGSPQGFEWLVKRDDRHPVFAWLRHDGQGRTMMVVSHFGDKPARGYRIGVPEGAGAWRVVLSTDAGRFGGGSELEGLQAEVGAVAAHERSRSIALDLPPLATLFLEPA